MRRPNQLQAHNYQIHFSPKTVYLIRFMNPTANKALHIGHLRNLLLGNASASCLEFAGATVIRHCIVEDVGELMGAAMAGFQLYRENKIKLSQGVRKLDHVVGECYARVKEMDSQDLNKTYKTGADQMRRWLLGDPRSFRIWKTVREMALSGQEETLNRLGIFFDRCDFESAEVPYARYLLDEGVRNREFVKDREGRLVYRNGKNRDVELLDKCGFPQENVFLLSFLYRFYNWHYPDYVTFAFAGKEWEWPMALFPQILEKFGTAQICNYHPVFYGLVTLQKKKMSSVTLHGVLIDSLMDQLTASPRVAGIQERSRLKMSLDEIVNLMIKIPILYFEKDQTLDFSIRDTLDEKKNPAFPLLEFLSETCRLENNHWREVNLAGAMGTAVSDDLKKMLLRATEYLSFNEMIRYVCRIGKLSRNDLRDKRRRRDILLRVRTVLSWLGLYSDRKSTSFQKLKPILPNKLSRIRDQFSE